MAFGESRGILFGAAVAAAALTLCLSGCSTSTVEEVAEAPGRSGQPADTDSFPNLNVPRHAAAKQFSDEETEAKLAHLNALQRRQNPGGTGPSQSAEASRERMKLAADEQEQTLRIIEGR